MTRYFEHPTDPSTMADNTADDTLTPEQILEMCEEEGVDVDFILRGDYNMSAKAKDNREPIDTADAQDLPFLNSRPEANTLGVLFVTKDLHAHLQSEAERLRRGQVSNLWWIATFALCEFGTQPTIEQVFHEAPAIAEDMDSFIYDRQAMPDGYQDPDGRIPRSTNQYRSIEDNAGRLLNNQTVIKTLTEAGYTADHLTPRELYEALAETARKRDVERKARDENASFVQKRKMEEAAKSATKRYGFEL